MSNIRFEPSAEGSKTGRLLFGNYPLDGVTKKAEDKYTVKDAVHPTWRIIAEANKIVIVTEKAWPVIHGRTRR